MFYIYILYSETSELYYFGYSEDPFKRLEEHNTSLHSTFTSKHRPWSIAALFEVGESRGEAMKIERFIKKQRSREFVKLLCNKDYIPKSSLAQLVRVPQLRD